MLKLRTGVLAGLLLGTALATLPALRPVPAEEATPPRTELQGSALCLALGQPPSFPTAEPVLLEGTGSHGWKIGSTVPGVQAWFDQGLRLAWNFNHVEAWRAFRKASLLDPGCAICAWGEAWVLGPNINDVMHGEAVGPARDALARAEALAANATEVERALIAALAARYPGDGAAVPSDEAAWADALAGVVARFPEDPVLLALHAEAMMNAQPWDYWEPGGVIPKGRGGEIVATLERALALDPDHPAAIHLYIHAVEASADPERAEPFADRLRGRLPALGHLLHMPSHIYLRIGRYADAVADNAAAVASDEAFLARADDAAGPVYRFGYYPHNVHFLLTAAQLSGRAAIAVAAAEKLGAVVPDEVAQAVPLAQPIKTAPYTVHAQLSDPATVLALPAPAPGLPFVEGFWRYARGVAEARRGDPAAAAAELAALDTLLATTDFSEVEAAMIPATAVLGVARAVLAARIALAQGDLATAEAEFRRAAAIEEGIPYMEPAYWYYPVRQSLGAVLLARGRAAEAEAAFRAALERQRRSGWALWGLMQAEAAQGKAAEAARTRAEFERVWAGDMALLSLETL